MAVERARKRGKVHLESAQQLPRLVPIVTQIHHGCQPFRVLHSKHNRIIFINPPTEFVVLHETFHLDILRQMEVFLCESIHLIYALDILLVIPHIQVKETWCLCCIKEFACFVLIVF